MWELRLEGLEEDAADLGLGTEGALCSYTVSSTASGSEIAVDLFDVLQQLPGSKEVQF